MGMTLKESKDALYKLALAIVQKRAERVQNRKFVLFRLWRYERLIKKLVFLQAAAKAQ